MPAAAIRRHDFDNDPTQYALDVIVASPGPRSGDITERLKKFRRLSRPTGRPRAGWSLGDLEAVALDGRRQRFAGPDRAGGVIQRRAGFLEPADSGSNNSPRNL